MAINMQIFKTRALTSAVFVVVMLAGILINQWTFLLLFSIIHFGCWVEYQRLIGLIDPEYAKINPVHKYAVMLAGWGFMLWMTTHFLYHIGNYSLHQTGFWIFIVMLIAVPVSDLLYGQFNLKLFAYSFCGLLYISLSWGLLINIRCYHILEADSGRIIVLMLVATIWINDTMAYIAGSLIGKTPLTPISPKKTWEGTIGGIVLAVLTVTLVSHFEFTTDYSMAFFFSLIAVVTGTFGDLLKSKLKRMANVKDSGNILPGHGGFLDRFDSLLLATPFVWLYMLYMITF